MLKITTCIYNYWRDANNYQQEKNTPVFIRNSLFRAVFSYTLKDFKNAKNENYYFLNPEHF